MMFGSDDGEKYKVFGCFVTRIQQLPNFKQVEVIEGKNWGGKVKESKKAEVSKEIFATLRENQMIF